MKGNTKTLIALVSVVVLALGWGAWTSGYRVEVVKVTPSTTASLSAATTSPPKWVEHSAGRVSVDALGRNIYTNNDYGFQFTIPQGWKVDSNILGEKYGGTFRLLHTTGVSRNKIEASIGPSDGPIESTSEEFPSSINTTQMHIAGELATRVTVELVDRSEEWLTYLIPLKATPGTALDITIFGDPSNFYVLDNLVRSITWQ